MGYLVRRVGSDILKFLTLGSTASRLLFGSNLLKVERLSRQLLKAWRRPEHRIRHSLAEAY